MAFPSNGINHYNAVKSEEELGIYTPQLKKVYSENISKIIHRGGTKYKEDNVLVFDNNKTKKISLKLKKKGLSNGSFDYVNTSAPSKVVVSSLETYNQFRGSGNVDNYKKLTDSINSDLNLVDEKFITDFFIKNVVDKYEDIDLIIIDEPNGKLYKVFPPSFSLVKNGGKLRVKPSNKPSMSRRVECVDKDGNVFDYGLRIRLHLNNGKTKWLNAKSSSLVIKFQQDRVHKLI